MMKAILFLQSFLLIYLFSPPIVYGQFVQRNQDFSTSANVVGNEDVANDRRLRDSILQLPSGVYQKISAVQQKLSAKMQHEQLKYLEKLEKQEKKIAEKISKIDRAAGKKYYRETVAAYDKLKQRVNQSSEKIKQKAGTYIPRMDSLKTMLKFLEPLSSKKGEISKAIGDVDAAKSRLSQASDLQSILGERQKLLLELTKKYSIISPEFKASLQKLTGKYGKTFLYYKAEISEWKETLKDPQKIETAGLKLLNKIPEFREFMQQNGELSKLFGTASTVSTSFISGLQSRQPVMQQLQQQLGAAGINPQQYIQQQLGAAQAELGKIQQQFNQLKSSVFGNGKASMPSFQINSQKTKPFLKRLEYGFDLQSGIRQFQFPASNAIAVNAGFKLSDRFTTGIGLAYKFSLGENIKKIRYSSDGIGFRSFIDFKISAPKKGISVLFSNIWITSGYEINYWSMFKNIAELQRAIWQESGLLGITKRVKVGKHEMKTQVLWDFLSYKSHTTPLIFRIGYTL